MIRAISIALLVPFFVAVAWLAVSVSDRTPPVTDVHIEITSASAIPQGANMQVRVSVFYRRSCSASISRMLYDARGQRYALPELALPPGDAGLQHSVSTLAIADNFAIGEGRYISRPRYACNWFQRVFWPIPMPERFAAFTVVPRTP